MAGTELMIKELIVVVAIDRYLFSLKICFVYFLIVCM